MGAKIVKNLFVCGAIGLKNACLCTRFTHGEVGERLKIESGAISFLVAGKYLYLYGSLNTMSYEVTT